MSRRGEKGGREEGHVPATHTLSYHVATPYHTRSAGVVFGHKPPRIRPVTMLAPVGHPRIAWDMMLILFLGYVSFSNFYCLVLKKRSMRLANLAAYDYVTIVIPVLFKRPTIPPPPLTSPNIDCDIDAVPYVL